MDNPHLLLFQIGPVQEFIAQAATPEDLWAGSYLLSTLVKAGLDVVPDVRNAAIFPNLSDGKIEEALTQNIPTLPNRFLVRVAGLEEGKEIARKAADAVRAKLLSYDRPEIPGFRRQLEQFLSITWAIRSATGNMGDDYKKLSAQLAARRNVRDFAAWTEDAAVIHAPKDFLSGKEVALRNRRGALNLVKQSLVKERDYSAGVKDVAKSAQPYYAVIAFDGDRMGVKLSGFKTADEHRAFSGALAAFALCVKDTIDEASNRQGTLVYAGGDDVLAVVPATCALECAKALRGKFSEIVGTDMTASSGVAIGHVKEPFQDLVKAAQTAEHRAKNAYGRNAVAVTALKRSGETQEWGFLWNKDLEKTVAVALFKKIRELTADAKARTADRNASVASLSGRFPYKLAALFRPYALTKCVDDAALKEQSKEKEKADAMVTMRDVVWAEFNHAWEQSRGNSGLSVPPEVEAYLDETFGKRTSEGSPKEETPKGRPEDFLNLFLCETFIDRPREERD